MLLLEKQRMSVQFEQTLLSSKLEIQEQTFTYIGREIHDNIGQVLSLVRLNLNTLTASTDEPKLTLMDELLGKAITDLRNLSHLLDTDYIRTEGWATAVEKLFHDLERSGKYSITTHIEEDLPVLGDEKSIILFRIIQEIINNTIKHAGATAIDLDAEKKGGQIAIRIKDNGKGFDKLNSGAGRGIRNMQSRSEMIDAIIDFDSRPGHGTLVTILINIKNNDFSCDINTIT